jgi:hypothetical protein
MNGLGRGFAKVFLIVTLSLLTTRLVSACGGDSKADSSNTKADAATRGEPDAADGDRPDAGSPDSGSDSANDRDASAPPRDSGTKRPPQDAATAMDAATPAKPNTPEEHSDPDEDSDGDGLTNSIELKLGTDPRYLDTDMDGISDDIEVSSDPSAPADADHDGVIDALENPKFDNDRDGMFDDADMATRWQIVSGRFVPAVLANDGSSPARFELKLARAADVQRVTVQMSSMYHRAEWAPDELDIDGVPLGNGKLELFDDGTHGDALAGDEVFSRGGIATHMPIRSDSGRTNGKRCRTLFNEVTVTTATGSQDLPIGTTSGSMPAVVPDFGFWLPVIASPLVEPVTAMRDVGQRTNHVLNLVDRGVALSLTQILMRGPSSNQSQIELQRTSAEAITKRALQAFDADFDFVYAFTSEPVYTTLAGFYLGLSNDVQGIGRDINAVRTASGSKGRLRGLLSFKMANEFPLTHETMHSWGVSLQPTLGTDDGHWGTAGTYGVLGGFDPTTLVDHGDGTFTLGHFSEAGNDWRTTPFSPLELYLAGFVPPSDVSPIPVLEDITVISNDTSGVTVNATKRVVTIDQIVTAFGARQPAATDARKAFDVLFVVVSDRLLNGAELGLIDQIASNYERAIGEDSMSFQQASGGRATLTTKLPAAAKP